MNIFEHKEYIAIENKLSEKISDNNNCCKQSLIKMEDSNNKRAPIYSLLSIGFLVYIWCYQIILIYNNAFAYKYSLLACFLVTYIFIRLYKINNNFISNHREKYGKKGLESGIVIISFLLYLMNNNPRTHIITDNFDNVWNSFFLLSPIGNNNYIYLIILCFFNIGIIVCYSSAYEKYRYLHTVCVRTCKNIITVYILFLIALAVLTFFLPTLIEKTLKVGNFILKKDILVYLFFPLYPFFFSILYQSGLYLFTYNLGKRVMSNLQNEKGH